MKTLLAWITGGLKKAGKAFLLLFVRVRGSGHWGRSALVAARVLVLVIVLIGLWWVNASLGLEPLLRPPVLGLGRVWLPLLFLLLLTAAWAGWSLWHVVVDEREASQFPDIDRAWLRALDDLGRAGIDLREAPLYLVLGRPASSLEGLLGASLMPFQVRPTAHALGAPIHVYASREGIFVTSEGASLLGRYAELVAELDVGRPGSRPQALVCAAAPANPTPVSAVSGAIGDSDAATSVAEREAGPAQRHQPTATLLQQQSREDERLTRRLRMLCLRIARERLPFCPVNGIVVALPFRATQGDDLAAHAWSVCRRDFATAWDALGVNCPVFAIVCDLERVEGYQALVDRVPEWRRAEPVGRDLPLVPDLPRDQVPDMIRRSVHWFAHADFPELIYRYWWHESGGEPGRANERLYRLLRDVQRGHDNLARVLVRGIIGPGASAPMLAGFYLVGTGAGEADRAFAAGVFRKALENQNAVAWTPQTIASDRRWRTRAIWAFVAIAIWSTCLLIALATILLGVGS